MLISTACAGSTISAPKATAPPTADSALDFLAVNRDFHTEVAELAGNRRLARQIGRLLDESARMLVLGLSARDRSGEMAHEHRALVHAMAEHDAIAAARIMHEQVAASRDMVLTALTGPRSNPRRLGNPMNAISRPVAISPLASMLADIADAARSDIATRHITVAAALAPYLGDPDLLAGRDCPCNPDRYCRHLLHNNAEQGYAVVAIVWTPGQMSPVHGHRTWCALGVHRGWLAETYFKRNEATAIPHRMHRPRPRRHQCRQHRPGRHPPHRQSRN